MTYLRFPASMFETLANLLETFPDVLKDSLIYSKSFLIHLRLILTCFDIPFEVFETLSIGEPFDVFCVFAVSGAHDSAGDPGKERMETCGTFPVDRACFFAADQPAGAGQGA